MNRTHVANAATDSGPSSEGDPERSGAVARGNAPRIRPVELPRGAQEPLTIGRYQIYGEIARGGMASVHLARLVGPLSFSRTVAVKRAHPQLARDADFAEMFLDEVRIASRIRHLNVVPTLDVLKTGDELLLVMDYVHGESLARLVEKGPIPVSIAGAILVDTLNGLHAAHEATDEKGAPLDVVHRDVSPANILLGLDGIARLADFGIAKAVGRIHTTRDCSVKGKFAYMAPEQIRGETVNRRTDVYAAAVVLWELLTGERLFAGRTHTETIQKSLFEKVSPPSATAPGISPKLDAVVLKGLARDPAERYATAREMARDIEACVEGIRRSEVGQWVEETAKHALAVRSAMLVAVEEAATASETDDDDAETIVRPLDELLADSCRRSEVSLSGMSQPEVGSSEAEPFDDDAEWKRLRPRPLGIAMISACLGLVVVAAGFFARGTPWTFAQGGTSETAPLAAQTASLSNAAASIPPPAILTTAGATEAPSPPAPPASASPPPAPLPSASSSAPRPAPTASSPPVKRPSCDPPYSIDEQGRTHFKIECL